MNIYFNDLTLTSITDVEQGGRILHIFLQEVWKTISPKVKSKVIFSNDKKYIYNTCFLPEKNNLDKQLFFSIFRSPYVNEEFEGKPEEQSYLESKFYLCKDGHEIHCHDLGCAQLKGTITVGLPSESFWEQLEFEIYTKNPTKTYKVLCLTCKSHTTDQRFTDWLERSVNTELVCCPLSPAEKAIHIRDDHGQDILLEFAHRLCNSPYIVGVINSLPFQPYQRELIDMKQDFEQGNISVCLHWLDNGPGLLLKTTAMNYYQAQKIAKIIAQEFEQKS